MHMGIRLLLLLLLLQHKSIRFDASGVPRFGFTVLNVCNLIHNVVYGHNNDNEQPSAQCELLAHFHPLIGVFHSDRYIIWKMYSITFLWFDVFFEHLCIEM